MAIQEHSSYADGQPFFFYRRNWEIKLHQWEHKFFEKFYRVPTTPELAKQLEWLVNTILNSEHCSDYQCALCDWGTIEVKPRDFAITESSSRKVYWRIGGDKTALVVWSQATCLNRLLRVEQTPAALESFMQEARENLGKQPDKMYTLWALDCYETLSNVYTNLRQRHMSPRSLTLVPDITDSKGSPALCRQENITALA